MSAPTDWARLAGRRAFLRQSSGFLGTLALDTLLPAGAASRPDARAKRVIQLFMSGGPSQVDLFDPKPKLAQWHGRMAPSVAGRVGSEQKVLAAPVCEFV